MKTSPFEQPAARLTHEEGDEASRCFGMRRVRRNGQAVGHGRTRDARFALPLLHPNLDGGRRVVLSHVLPGQVDLRGKGENLQVVVLGGRAEEKSIVDGA